MTEPTDDEVAVFGAAWEAERKRIGRGIAPAGTKTRAGLRAAFALHDESLHVERDSLAELIEREYDRADPLDQGFRPDGTSLAGIIIRHLRNL